MTRPARLNPARGIAASRASASTLRPCAPTEQIVAPAKTYRCPCGASIALTAAEPLPADWSTVIVPARKGAPERTGYRCGKCRRRALVMALTAEDRALHIMTKDAALWLAAWCERKGLGDRGICTVIDRMHAERAAGTWAEIVDRATGGAGEVGR